MLWVKVRNPDSSNPATFENMFKRFPGLDEFAKLGVRPVNQQHVNVANVQPRERLVDCLECVVVSVSIIPNLGGYKNLFTLNT